MPPVDTPLTLGPHWGSPRLSTSLLVAEYKCWFKKKKKEGVSDDYYVTDIWVWWQWVGCWVLGPVIALRVLNLTVGRENWACLNFLSFGIVPVTWNLIGIIIYDMITWVWFFVQRSIFSLRQLRDESESTSRLLSDLYFESVDSTMDDGWGVTPLDCYG